MIIIFVFILTACGGKSSVDSENILSAPIDTTIAHLKDTIGKPDKVKGSAKLPRDLALAAAEDYSPGTGKWFEGEDGFNLITSITSGEAKAGSEAGAALSRIPEGRSVRFQITSRDEDGKRIELIKEYVADNKNTVNARVDFSHKMPDQPNKNYLLSIEILSSEDVVEDTLLTPIFVPPHELNARLTVLPPVQGSDQTELVLYNAGPTELFLGYGYHIYQKESDGWRIVPIEGAVEAIGIIVKSGESYKEKVVLPQKLERGQYRLVKLFEGNMTDVTVRLAADFEIR